MVSGARGESRRHHGAVSVLGLCGDPRGRGLDGGGQHHLVDAAGALPALGPLVHRASEFLDKMGPTSRSVSVDWKFTKDSAGRIQVLLTLADDTGVPVTESAQSRYRTSS